MKNHDKPDNPLVSVIVPVYNVERYLRQCLDSILGQPYRNLDVVIVDDASTDGSPDICDRYAERDSRVRVVHKAEHLGAGMARNSGLEMARGEYIMFSDSDDWWDADVLDRLVDRLLDTDADMLLFAHDRERPDGSIEYDCLMDHEHTFEGRGQIVQLAAAMVHRIPQVASQKVGMSVWAMIVKRQMAGHRFMSEREVSSEDMAYKIQAVLKCNRVVFTPIKLVNYRYNRFSLSHTYSFGRFSRLATLTERLKPIFADTDCPTAGDYCMIYALQNTLRAMFYNNIPRQRRKLMIREIVQHPGWHRISIDTGRLTLKQHLAYWPIPRNHWRVLVLIAELFYGLKRNPLNHRRNDW